MAADVTQRTAGGDLVTAAFHIEIPLQEANLEGVRGYRDTGVAPQARQRGAFGQSQIEGVHQRAEEQEELHARQYFAQTHSSTDSERHEVFRLANLTLVGEETGRSKGLRLIPEFRVHVHCVQQRHYLGTSWNRVAVQCHVSVTRRDGIFHVNN